MDQNNLDKLFQDKLEDFSSVPEQHVWERIEASLNNKRKKRVVPIWWWVGGSAAILVIAILLFNPSNVNEAVDQAPVVNTEEKKQEPAEGNEIIDHIDENFQETSEGIAEQNPEVINSVQEKSRSQEGSVPYQNYKNKAAKNPQQLELVSSDVKEPKTNENDDNSIDKGNTRTLVPNVENSETAVVDNANEQNIKLVKDEEDAVAISEKESEKKSIYDAIEEQLEVEDETLLVENTQNKWSIGPSVAPVYFNAIGSGSPIHSNFSENSKSGNINMSYGVAVGYDVGKRLKVRSGVHRVNMGYNTEEILFSSSVDASTNAMIDNINYNQTSRSLVVQSRKNTSVESMNTDATTTAELVDSARPALDGNMVQQLGYFEVPLELNYALVDKKFGVDLIGGVSSLFLVDNSVSLESNDGLITEMGEANNVNSVNFSTNVGLGLNYQFSEKIQLNVEPIFKYQLNTFTESAGNFNPYSVGVYSGFSFRF